MTLPKQYAWLDKEPGPKMLLEALKLHGTIETPGKVNNAKIIAWAKEVGGAIADVYKADSIPWCGLFAAVVAQRAGWDFPKNALWALSWSAWGTPVDQPMLGDILTFVRQGGGHVGLYIGEDKTAYHVLGGNQSDKVSIARILKTRFYAARRPKWRTAQPKNVRKIVIAASGAVSKNEK